MAEKSRQNAIELNNYDSRLKDSAAGERHELASEHESRFELA